MKSFNVHLACANGIDESCTNQAIPAMLGSCESFSSDINQVAAKGRAKNRSFMLTTSKYYSTEQDWKRVLEDSFPEFLTLIDSDLPKAMDMFQEYAYKVLITLPPRALRTAEAALKKDLIQDTIIYFIIDDCKVLRKYRNQGKPFRNWFLKSSSYKMFRFVTPTALGKITRPFDD